MAPQALINRDELASLLVTTSGAISQMAYRGELPPTAFPEKRRACWFVRDIRAWLDDAAANRRHAVRQVNKDVVAGRRPGRPRLAVSDGSR
jgi:hypothetical protein